MEVSESVKELLWPFADQEILIYAEEVYQPVNPGDGLIRKLRVLGRPKEPEAVEYRHLLSSDDLSLSVAAEFDAPDGPGLILELRNASVVKGEIDVDALAPTLLAKKQGPRLLEVSDGPSYVVITRVNVGLMRECAASPSCTAYAQERAARFWLAPGVAVSGSVELGPWESVIVPLRFELPQGEYEFLAGYGGGVHATPTLASNRIGFDIDRNGKPHLVKDPDRPR